MWANPKFLSVVLDHVLPGVVARALRGEANSLVIVFSQVLLRNLAKPAQHMPVVEFTLLEIAGAAERNGTGMSQDLPQPLRRLYRDRRTCAVNGFTGDKAAIAEVKSQCHEMSDFGHECPLCGPRLTVILSPMTEPIALVSMNSVRHLIPRKSIECTWF